jgi:hypothetical protein
LARTARPRLSDTELVELFSHARSPERLIEGLRALGFTAESIAEVTNASSRDAVYAWAAGRSIPSGHHAEQLDRLRSIVSWICRQPQYGPRSVWLVLNGWPGGLDPTGPTALSLLANRHDPDEWLRATDALGMAIGKSGPRKRRIKVSERETASRVSRARGKTASRG